MSVPRIPFQHEPSGSQIELYDSEIPIVESVLRALNQKVATMSSVDAFDREAKDRFRNAGFEVSINWYDAIVNDERCYLPEIAITGRIERKDDDLFDHERQAHEVQTDLLELGEGGIIKPSAADLRRFGRGGG